MPQPGAEVPEEAVNQDNEYLISNPFRQVTNPSTHNAFAECKILGF